MASSKEYLHFILEQLSDTLPEVRQQNTHHGPGAYGTGRFSAVLPQMQVYLRDPLHGWKTGRNQTAGR